MKRFFIYLASILIVVSIGFGIYSALKQDQTVAISINSLQVNIGDKFRIDVVFEDENADKAFDVSFNKPGVLSYDKQNKEFTALTGENVIITFTTKSSQPEFRNIPAYVYVGDGSTAFPFVITTAEQLSDIGVDSRFALDKSYRLLRDIDASMADKDTGLWLPIGSENDTAFSGFSGWFDGNGYTVKNIKINKDLYNELKGTAKDLNTAGMFHSIASSGYIFNLKIKNFEIVESSSINVNYGTVAGINYGRIERVEIIDSVINTNMFASRTSSFGGVVGKNESTPQFTATIDRVSVTNMFLGATPQQQEFNDSVGVPGMVGGIAGENHGGIIVYSYAKGNVVINNNTDAFGGIVGLNKYINTGDVSADKYYNTAGGHIKDTYNVVTLVTKHATTNVNKKIGGVVGINDDTFITPQDESTKLNRLIGNYYVDSVLNAQERDNSGVVLAEKKYSGIGLYLNNDIESTYVAEDHQIVAASSENSLKDKNSFISYKTFERTYNKDTGDIESSTEKIVAWKFDSVWKINSKINEGYPYLSYDFQKVASDIYNISDQKTIKNVSDLMNMKLDGNYILVQNIDLSESSYGAQGLTWKPWEPIGTLKNPFVGTIEAGSYVVGGVQKYFGISGLTTYYPEGYENADGEVVENRKTNREYAGLFGVTSNARQGYIKNLVIEKANIMGVNAGAIAGINGYDYVDGDNVRFAVGGMQYYNVSLIASKITGTFKVGGIVGENRGVIVGGILEDEYNNKGLSVGHNVIRIIPRESNANAGGIAGVNYGTISNVLVAGFTEVVGGAEISEDDEETVVIPYSVNLGGIAGVNRGLIHSVVSKISEIKTINPNTANAGGIAGINYSTIKNSVVNGANVITDATDSYNYVGGIVGKQLNASFIENVLVSKTSVIGYYVGGAVGYVEYANGDYVINNKKDNKGNIVEAGNQITITKVGVDNDTKIVGSVAGGLFGEVVNGIISDVYAITTISGVDNKSIKAGVVGSILYTKSGNGAKMGVIQKVYSVTNFGPNGKAYAVSKSDFLIDTLRGSGFIYNFAYDKTVAGNAETPYTEDAVTDWIKSWWGSDTYFAEKTSVMKTRKKYEALNFSSSTWILKDGQYAQLASLSDLENSVSKVNININADETGNITIVPANDGIKVVNNVVKLNKYSGFVFTVSVNDVVKLDSVKIFINGIEINSVNGLYTIYGLETDANISYEYQLK